MDLAVNEAGDQHATGQAVALSSVVYAASNALNLDQTWLARLMAFALRAFCASNDWQSIVQKGSRYYSLCGSTVEGSRFSEQNFPVLIYAQQQIVNHQEALLKTAEQELNAFVTAFQEQEAKKKKKKSRLVVEEVLPPEELAFRASKQEMELKIQQLVSARDLERDKLVELEETFDAVSRAVNKSLQALNSCHELVEKYRRLKSQDDPPALRRQILASFNRCVILARQKRQTRVVCQALQETGDFHLASGDLNAARKSWLEALDNAYSTLNVGATWREVLTPTADQFLEGSKDKINGDELWIGLQCCSALAKLTLHSSGVNEQQAVSYALMGAAIFTRFYCCSVPHPTKCFLYGSYRIAGQFWPGRELLTDPDRVSAFPLGLFFVLLPEILLQYGHQHATTVMPVIAGYEYVAESCLEDDNHIANARRLRVEALVQCGRFHEAFQVLGTLIRGRMSDMEPDTVSFHDGKHLLDESNRPALDWLLSLKMEQVQVDLEKRHPHALVIHILASILHLAVTLSRHESRYDRDTAIVRSAAKKMAQALLSIVQPSETVEDSSRTWEELQFHRVRTDFHLQLSYLAFFEGDWNASKASSMDAIAEINLIPFELRLELDQKLKFSLVLSRGTFLAQCRVQLVACCLAQTCYRSAFETAQLALEETRVAGEEQLRQQLEMQRLHASVFLGEREKSERELFDLREDALVGHTSESLTYVYMIQTLSSILRSKALVTSQSVLKAVHGKEAKRVLDVLLEHDGWVGVGSSSSSLEKRLNLYRPAVPEFVQVHSDLAQVLLELPFDLEHDNSTVRQERALASVNDGLRALEHTAKRMAATKARLLLLKGILLARPMRDNNSTPIQQFEDCTEAFTGCIKASIEGGYDRQVVRCALIELVDLFGRKLLPDCEDTHVQAAFHYLNLALEVQKHEFVLFDTLELQNGSVSSVEKLPASVCVSINAQSESEEDSTTAPSNSKAPDVTSLVNFFVRLLRMQHILPVSAAELQDTCALLHSFLVLHHSSYGRLACLTDLPPVPSSDPEIRAGLVCALWGQDLAPALAITPGDSNSKLTFYFTLGTTKVSIIEGSPAAGNDEAMTRVEKFASSPLLSKRCNLDRQSVHHLKAALSSLRTQMEDEDSLLIDRSLFPKMLLLSLRQVQQLFRLHASEEEGRGKENLIDRFGNPISIECTLEIVRRLEDLFSINKGVNIADNELCYFLRDLLD
ncbi:Cilia- and flagella-associated protein 54 [Phytophthora citrophthora]|uniref:Cilia- and flagella-associated protein 54 n=1 Tax=Phytophthora citrophthora TaxID=4793 RepID=A0AAD9LDY8_9STRA|nr:Cilia- and flagella-associated protein 54 [Phytophthora citrophthora]